MKEVLVIIPSYNEELNIAGVLDGLLRYKEEVDILVVDDGSFDHTASIVREYPVFLVSHPCNLGYGASLQTGYRFAQQYGYRYVIQFDADGQHDPFYIREMMDRLLAEDADIVMGSRYMDSSVYSAGKLKGCAVHFFRSLIYLLTKVWVTDPTSGFRGMKRPVFQYYAGSGRFPADYPDADMLLHMIFRNYKIREFSVSMHERRAGVSMHGGIKPVFYMAKMMLSIFVVLVRSWISGEKEFERGVES